MANATLKLMEDGDYQKLWFSHSEETGDNGELTYVFVRCEYTDEWGDGAKERLGAYHFSIVTVAPYMLSDKDKEQALDGWEGWRDQPDLNICDGLMGYGYYATLWQETGNNKAKLMSAARKELAGLRVFLGFALDRNQNAIGSSGWDFMAGNPTGALSR